MDLSPNLSTGATPGGLGGGPAISTTLFPGSVADGPLLGDFKSKKVLVWDAHGLATEHAVRLTKDFGQVFYYTLDSSTGIGIDGIEKVFHFFDFIDKVDLICFFGSGSGDLTQFLRQKGYNVYGAGYGERLEESQWRMRTVQQKIGLPTQRSVKLTGISQLQRYLKDHTDKLLVRDNHGNSIGDFYHKDYASSGTIIDEIEADWGPLKEECEYVAENPVNGLSIGVDGFFSGNWVMPTCWGFALENAYIGKYSDKVPPFMRNTMERLTPLLDKLNYRGAISTTEQVISKTKSYLSGLTCGFSYIPSLVYPESIKNYSDVILNCAMKQPIKLDYLAPYIAAIYLDSPQTERYWIQVSFDNKIKRKVKLQNYCIVDGKYYCVKGKPNGVFLVSLGNNIKRLVRDITKSIDGIDVYGLDKAKVRVFGEIYENINRARQLGIDF